MSKRVLLVDNSETVIQVEKLMLRGLGYDLSTAKKGKLALADVATQKPDPIMLKTC